MTAWRILPSITARASGTNVRASDIAVKCEAGWLTGIKPRAAINGAKRIWAINNNRKMHLGEISQLVGISCGALRGAVSDLIIRALDKSETPATEVMTLGNTNWLIAISIKRHARSWRFSSKEVTGEREKRFASSSELSCRSAMRSARFCWHVGLARDVNRRKDARGKTSGALTGLQRGPIVQIAANYPLRPSSLE